MNKMRTILLCVIFIYGLVNIDAIAGNIQKWVASQFSSPTVKMFYEHWKKYRKPIENSIQIMLKETFGEQGMNIYVRKTPNARRVAKGFFVSDNVVNVLFKDLYLTEFPHLTTPEVSFALASNVLRVDADVRRMIVDAKYLLFRNLSDVTYSVGTFDPYRNSPFSLQQVSNDGQATIVVDGCVLSGFAIPTLQAQSVNLGHNFFRLRKCKCSVEISTPENGSPPVIAPYFSETQSTQLSLLLVKPIQEELMTKLQGAMFTYVNTSAIFGQNLPEIRQHQQATFAKTSKFMTEVVANLNAETFAENRGVVKLEDEIFSWTDKYKEKVQESKVTIANMTLRGLDSTYSAQTGGPFRVPDAKIEDTIRIAALQVRGNINYQVDSKKSEHVFYGEIQDLQAHVSMSIETAKTIHKVEIIGWRHLDLHTPDLPVIAPQSLVTGVLLNKIPIMVMQHLSQYLGDAISLASKESRWEGADKQSKPEEQGNIQDGVDNENDEVKEEFEGSEDESRYSDGSYNRDNDENVEQNINEEETPPKNMGDNFSGREDVTQKSMLGKPMFEKPMFNKPMFEKPMFGNKHPSDALVGDGLIEEGPLSNYPQDQDVGQIKNEEGGDVNYDENETQRNVDEGDSENINDDFSGREDVVQKSMLGKPMFEKPMFDKPMFKKPALENPMFGNEPSDALAGDGPVEGSLINVNPQDQDVGTIEHEEGGDVDYEESETQRANENDQENNKDYSSGREDVKQKSMLGKPMLGKPMFGKPMFEKPMFAKPMFDQPMFKKPAFEKPMFGNPSDVLVGDGPVEGSLISDNARDQDVGLIENEEGGDVNYEENEKQRNVDGSDNENLQENIRDNSSGREDVIQNPMLGKPIFEKPMFEKPMFDQPMFKKPAFEKPMFGNPSDVLVGGGPVEGSLLSDNPQDQDVGQIENEEGGDVNYEENETQRNVDGSDNENVQENIRDDSSGKEDVIQKSMHGKPMFEKPMFDQPMFKKPAFERPVFGNKNPSDALDGPAEGSLLSDNPEDQDIGRIENKEKADDVHFNGKDSASGEEGVPQKSMLGTPMLKHTMFGKHMFGRPMFGSGSSLRSQRDKIERKNNNKGNVKGNRKNNKQKDKVTERKLNQRRAQNNRKKSLNTNKPRNATQHEKQARMSDNEIHSE